MSEVILKALKKQGEAFDEFKSRYDEEMSGLERNVDGLMKRGPVGFMGGSGNKSSNEGLEAVGMYLSKNDASGLQEKTMNIGTPSEGGNVVADDIDESINESIEKFRPALKLAGYATTNSNVKVTIHTVSGAGTEWNAELSSRNLTAEPALEKNEYKLAMLTSTIPYSQEWGLSSFIDVGNWLVRETAKGRATKLEQAMFNGSGVVEPKGILTAAVSALDDDSRAWGEIQYLTSSASGVFDGDDLISLYHSLAQEFHDDASWVMSIDALEAARKLKDGNGNYIWTPANGVEGRSEMLFGFPVYTSTALPAVAAGSMPIVFGNFKEGYLRVEHESGTAVLRDPYSTLGIIKVHASIFAAGGVADSRSLKCMKLAP